jgi:NADH dehydrogenase
VFQPLLYQVATGMLSPANIATPLRSVFRRQRNVEVLLEEVVAFDLVDKLVRCRGRDFPYDTLVLAAGVRHHYFGRDDWAGSLITPVAGLPPEPRHSNGSGTNGISLSEL